MRHTLFGILLLCFSLVTPTYAADTMFEGYYRIEVSGKHAGYAILRYEFEPKDQSFQLTSFTRLQIGETPMQESLKAKANDKLQPISYSYTLQDGDQIKTIDASFKGEIMTLKIADGKKLQNQTHKIPKGTFLAGFLNYLILQKPFKVGQAFSYSAVAEEEGASYSGKTLIDSVEKKEGFELYKVANSFKGDRFISEMAVVKDVQDSNKNVRGEVLAIVSPAKGVVMTLVNDPAKATAGHSVPNKILTVLFGTMPTGKMNLLNKEK